MNLRLRRRIYERIRDMTTSMKVTEGRWSVRKLLLIYTLVFCLFFSAAFFMFARAQHTFIWNVDGGPQYVPYLAYIGMYLRDFFGKLFTGHFAHRMIDFSIGMGSDVGAVFRPHPLDFLSVFVPADKTEILYQAIMILRMYLGGLSFIAFCRYLKKPDTAALAGSMVYIFCGYTFKLGIEHSTFLSALIVLPLLLLTAQRMMDGKGGLLFSLVTCMGFLSNYYFMYMCTIAMTFYVILSIPGLAKKTGLRRSAGTVTRMVLYYLLGMGMSAAALIPIASALADSPRLAKESGLASLWHYKDASRWWKCLIYLIVPHGSAGNATYLNYQVIMLPALAVFLTKKLKEHLRTAAALLLCTAALLIPAGPYLMTLFSALNNRWIFILGFVLSYVCVLAFEDLASPDRRTVLSSFALSAVYFAVAAFGYFITGKRQVLLACAMLAACLAGLVMLRCVRRLRRYGSCALIGGMILCTAMTGLATYSWKFGGFVSEFLHRGIVMERMAESPQSRLAGIDDEGFYRSDTTITTSTKENYSLVLGYFGTSMYNSLLSGPLVEYLLEQENNGLNAIHRIFGLDGCTGAEALANVRYFLSEKNNEAKAPYGFVRVDDLSDEEYTVFYNRYYLPFGYTYDSVITREDYDALDAAAKQQVMLHAAVVDTADLQAAGESRLRRINGCPEEILSEKIALPQEGDGACLIQGGIRALENDGKFTVTYTKKAGYDCYLRLENFTADPSLVRVDIITEGQSTEVALRRSDATYSTGRDDFMVRLGYAEEDKTDTLTISMRAAGDYSLGGVYLVYIPMDGYADAVSDLADCALDNMTFSGNTFAGTVDAPGERLMVFSVPYSRGWRVYVDGKNEEALRVNTAYTGVLIPEGEHDIRLTYTSPGSAAGLWICAACWAIFLLVIAVRCLKKRADHSVQTDKALL